MVAPKIQTTFFLECQWMPQMDEKKYHREMSNWSSVMQELYWSYVLFFQKDFVREKLNFGASMLIPRCQCWYFQMIFKMCRINNQNNVAEKLNKIKDIHQNKIELGKHKHTIQGLQGLRNVY